jgi:hypothetical protein
VILEIIYTDAIENRVQGKVLPLWGVFMHRVTNYWFEELMQDSELKVYLVIGL